MNTDTTNIRNDANTLKGFDKYIRGPIKYFQRNWFIPFVLGLGSVTMDNVSLRDTWLGVDNGGPNGPNGNAAQVAQRAGRVRRIYAILVNYIDPKCSIYDEIRELFPDDGISAMNYIQLDGVGNIPITPEEITAMNNDWNIMDFKKLPENVVTAQSNEQVVQCWGNAVKIQAKRFPNPKTATEQYSKFLDGLPPQLQQKVMDEREQFPQLTIVHPPNYPANYPNVALQGQVHPLAGQPDMTRVIAKYSRFWNLMIDKGLIKANYVQDVSPDDAMFAGGRGRGKGKGRGRGGRFGGKGGRGYTPKTPSRPISNKTCCYKCGGLNHVAKIQNTDGSWTYCASQEQVDKSILDGIIYPHIPSAAERRSRGAPSNSANQADEEPAATPNVGNPNISADDQMDDTEDDAANEADDSQDDEYEAQWAAFD